MGVNSTIWPFYMPFSGNDKTKKQKCMWLNICQLECFRTVSTTIAVLLCTKYTGCFFLNLYKPFINPFSPTTNPIIILHIPMSHDERDKISTRLMPTLTNPTVWQHQFGRQLLSSLTFSSESFSFISSVAQRVCFMRKFTYNIIVSEKVKRIQ